MLRAGDSVKFVPVEDDGGGGGGGEAGGSGAAGGGGAAAAGGGGGGGGAEALATPWAEVVAPGPLTTVQDAGRQGYARHGVSRSGAADGLALRMGNALVGNPAAAAGLEVTLGGLRLRSLAAAWVALTGADCGAALRRAGREEPVRMHTHTHTHMLMHTHKCMQRTCNAHVLRMPHAPQVRVRVNRAVALQPGDELSLGAATDGVRSYLCVGGGGVSVPSVLGSLSTDVRAGLGGHQGRALRAGDSLGRRTNGGEEAAGEAAAGAAGPGLVCAVYDWLRQDRGGGGGSGGGVVGGGQPGADARGTS